MTILAEQKTVYTSKAQWTPERPCVLVTSCSGGLGALTPGSIEVCMTVTFTASGKDGRHLLWYMITKTLTARCLLALLLLMPAAIPALILHGIASEHAAQPLRPSFFWIEIAFSYFLLLLALLLGLAFASVLKPGVTVTFDAQSCSWKSYNTPRAYPRTLVWRNFKTVTEDADYIFLLGWKFSFYIPMSAFPSRAEAEAFHEKMYQSWQDAK